METGFGKGNGVKYTVDSVEKIPDELRFKNRRTGNAQEAEERNKGKTQRERPKEQGPVRDDKRGEDMDVTAPQDIGSEQFQNKNWDQASRAASTTPNELEMEGAMHLTKRGLAFFTGKTYLSNSHLIEMRFNGRSFPSAEHVYQYEKASVCRDTERIERIYKAKTPKDAKDIGREVKTTPFMGET